MWFLTALLDVLREIKQAVLDASPLSAQALLDLIKTVDGSGSGLDADLVDGRDDIVYKGGTEVPSHTLQRTDVATGAPFVEMLKGDGTQHTVVGFSSGAEESLISLRTQTYNSGERAGIALDVTLDTPLEQKAISAGNYDAVAGAWAMAEALGNINNSGTFAIRASDGWVSYSGGRFEMAIVGGQLTARSAMSGDYALTVQFVGAGH